MKHLFLILLCSLLTVLNTRAEGEPSQVPLADPYILLEDGKYYAYGTHDASGIRCYSSDDLRTWKDEGQALNKANTTEEQWFWAPEVYHVNGHYIMYFSANEHLFAATADSPKGPFKQVGSYQMESLIGSEKCIDSHVFFDDNGKAYVFFVRFTDGNCIWQAELEDDYITPKTGTLRKCFAVSQSWENKMGRVNEGPNVIKIGKRYFLTYSGNDYRSQDYGVGFATTNNIASGTWSKYSSNPILCRFDDLVGTGHHSLFYDKEGILRIVFHAHESKEKVGNRLMYIGTVTANSTRLAMSNEPIIRPTLSTTAPYNPEMISSEQGFQGGGAVTVDLNNDGNQDIVAGGYVNQVQNSAEDDLTSKRNTYAMLYLSSTHKWSKVTSTPPFRVSNAPSLIPCDINNDGKMDIIAFENNTDADTEYSQEGIFLGAGNGTFSTATLSFTDMEGNPCTFNLRGPCCADIIDVDNDGRLDIVCAGHLGEESYNVILHNKSTALGELTFCVEPYEQELQFSEAIIQAADLNNDGYQDFAISSVVDNVEGQIRFTDVYLNDTLQHGRFLRQGLGDTGGSIKRKSNGTLQLADLNNDGWLDIYLSGLGESSSGESTTRQRIYANKQQTKPEFSQLSNTDLLADSYNTQSSVNNSSGIIDWNGDGTYDIFIGGLKGAAKTSTGQLYLNNGKGRMSKSVAIPGSTGASIIFPDWNGDGRKDFVSFGNCTDNNYLKLCPQGINAILCYNLGAIPSRPDAPLNCQAEVNADGSVTFTWDAPETAQACYTYEIFVQDSEGNLLNSTPAFIGDAKDGVRKVNRMGRVGCQKTWQFFPLSPGTYKWGVQTVNAAFTGSTFTEGPEFSVSSEEDGINDLKSERVKSEKNDDATYDLTGRKVTKPLPHLIYIKEGRKELR
ncbi:MAG: family 43 glycosylhydrolase [Bacteroidaceae bacterium]|nr:family 43 glycosylhydrolase [Bacteroidaceae bacterium]